MHRTTRTTETNGINLESLQLDIRRLLLLPCTKVGRESYQSQAASFLTHEKSGDGRSHCHYSAWSANILIRSCAGMQNLENERYGLPCNDVAAYTESMYILSSVSGKT